MVLWLTRDVSEIFFLLTPPPSIVETGECISFRNGRCHNLWRKIAIPLHSDNLPGGPYVGRRVFLLTLTTPPAVLMWGGACEDLKPGKIDLDIATGGETNGDEIKKQRKKTTKTCNTVNRYGTQELLSFNLSAQKSGCNRKQTSCA